MVRRKLTVDFKDHHERISKIQPEIRKWIVGMDNLIEMLLVCLLSKGHLLTEGRVGEGKTRTLDAFPRVVGGGNFNLQWEEQEGIFVPIESSSFKRIQFTPDRLPESLVRIVKQRSDGTFEFRPGPIFCHFLLGDEFNRASERTRSPLLEAMEDAKVTIDGVTIDIPKPYMVLATINPTDVEGTFKLGAAQSDRFSLKVYTEPETRDELFEVLKYRRVREVQQLETKVTREEILAAQEFVADKVYISDDLRWYLVDIAIRAREMFEGDVDDRTTYGASGKRPAISLDYASQALAFIRGQAEVTPDIVKELAPAVIRHRVSTGWQNSRREIEDKIQEILEQVESDAARNRKS